MGMRLTIGLGRAALVAAVVLAAAAGAGASSPASSPTISAANAAKSPAGLEVLADPVNAPVSIVIFSDYECPYSSQFYFDLQDLAKKYPGRLRIKMRQLPLSKHEQSPLAHEAALAAAAQGKLAGMSELLFANQTRLEPKALYAYARQLHLDDAAFRQAMDTHEYRPIVEEDLLEAKALGITQTPTIFVNGQRFEGAQSTDVLEKAISAGTSKKSAPQKKAVRVSSPRNDNALSATTFRDLTKAAMLVRGPANAPVTIVEFSDFQCPFCRRSVEPLEELVKEHPKDVRLVFRSFPLDFHQYSELAHEAALAAAAQGKFWEMHDLLFANQSQLDRADLFRYAEQLKLDMAEFENALDTHVYAGAVAADRALGAKFGVDGTPMMFINGKRLGGARTLPELEQVVDEQERVAKGTALEQAVIDQAPPGPDTDFVVSGSDAAAIRVTWITDVRSPLAPRTAELVRALVAAYPGQIRVNFKTMQLASHPDAEIANRALLAAGSQQKFWEMYDALAQSDGALDRDAVVQKAAEVGVDGAAFQAAMDAAGTTESMERDQAEEVRRAVLGSPAIFIGDVRIDGLQQEKMYRAAIDAAIAARVKTETASSGR